MFSINHVPQCLHNLHSVALHHNSHQVASKHVQTHTCLPRSHPPQCIFLLVKVNLWNHSWPKTGNEHVWPFYNEANNFTVFNFNIFFYSVYLYTLQKEGSHEYCSCRMSKPTFSNECMASAWNYVREYVWHTIPEKWKLTSDCCTKSVLQITEFTGILPVTLKF